jgi:6,7-dimethyl-8-ribityllumazine synthase
MSGSGTPVEILVEAEGRRLAVVASRWHEEIVDALLGGAYSEARACGIRLEDVRIVRVPGAFELPVVARGFAVAGHVDAIVCLGVVVRGGTPHFDHVCRAVTDGCLRVALDHGIPVGFGVLTVDTLDQARERLDKGREAVRAALETLAALDVTKGA